MKYLQDYLNKPQAELEKKCNAFYAFSQQQFDERKQPEIDYVHLGHGLYVPRENAKSYVNDLEQIFLDGVKQDLKDHTETEIIWRELANHEVQFDGELSSVYLKLTFYPITKEEIDKEYKKYYLYCCENDLF